MFFKNLQTYRLPAGWAIGRLAELTEQLARKTFQPCGSQDHETRGFVPPCGADLVHVVGGEWLICLQTEQRLLPAAVVQQEAQARADEMAEQQGYKPGRKQMKEIKEAITQELLPRAFTRRRKTFAWISPAAGFLAIDAPSQARAEDVLEVLRQALDHFPLSLLRTELSPTSAMADWLAADEAPDGFAIEQDFSLQSVCEDKATATFKRLDTEAAHVREHLTAGKLPTRLALTFDDRVSFVLTEKLEIKRLDFLDVVKDNLQNADDAQALFDTGFALMTGELLRLLPAIVRALGGELQRPTEPDYLTAPDGDGTDMDPLYAIAKTVVKETGRPSISTVQRHLRIGYNRAAHLLETMERDGLLSPTQSNGVRAVIESPNW